MAEHYSSEKHLDKAQELLVGGSDGVEIQRAICHCLMSLAINIQFLVNKFEEHERKYEAEGLAAQEEERIRQESHKKKES